MAGKYWLVLRGLANHFLPLWYHRADLVDGMEEVILHFAVAREVRPADSEVIQTLTEMLIPEATKNTRLMRRVLYDRDFVQDGAYVRVMTHHVFTHLLQQKSTSNRST